MKTSIYEFYSIEDLKKRLDQKKGAYEGALITAGMRKKEMETIKKEINRRNNLNKQNTP